MNVSSISYEQHMSVGPEWFIHCARHRLSHSIPRRLPDFQNLWPIFLLPYTTAFVEVLLHIGRIRFRRRRLILGSNGEYHPPEGQSLSTVLVNIIWERKRYEEDHSRRVDCNAQMVPQESGWIGTFQNNVSKD